MLLDPLVAAGARSGASDLHLEVGLPVAYRIRGEIVKTRDVATSALTDQVVREVLGPERLEGFLRRRSADVSLEAAGLRCRGHFFRTSRGTGAAIRIFPAIHPTIENCNLHPDLADMLDVDHGLVIVSGPTGSGKSSTLAALVDRLNESRSAHIVTVEQPIEFVFKSKRAFIRQREVGDDTPSFEQGLHDSLREDPDVVMVGEMRDPDTIQLTLTAAETGHLVLATLHSASPTDAIERIVAAFPPEIQGGIRSQVAEVLRGVVVQRLVYVEDLGFRIPECEILRGTSAVRNSIRQGQLFKIASILQTGASDGMWTLDRYREWMAAQTNWNEPTKPKLPAGEPLPDRVVDLDALTPRAPEAPSAPDEGVINLEEAASESFDDLLSKMKREP